MKTKNFKKIVCALKDIPDPVFKTLCNYLGVIGEDYMLLKLRFRESPKYTREYIAEELGMSVSTLDRRIESIIGRIDKYALHILDNVEPGVGCVIQK